MIPPEVRTVGRECGAAPTCSAETNLFRQSGRFLELSRAVWRSLTRYQGWSAQLLHFLLSLTHTIFSSFFFNEQWLGRLIKWIAWVTERTYRELSSISAASPTLTACSRPHRSHPSHFLQRVRDQRPSVLERRLLKVAHHVSVCWFPFVCKAVDVWRIPHCLPLFFSLSLSPSLFLITWYHHAVGKLAVAACRPNI